MKMILGKKIGMISSFLLNGKMIPVTVIHSEPNIVLESKLKDIHGYDATKVGFEKVEEKKLLKPQVSFFKKIKVPFMKYIREFRNVTGYNVGDKINVEVFSVNDSVDVQSISKGKGFTGAIKRWNFKCGPKSHGAGYPHRYQGSISFGRGGSQGQRVMKGKKMSGHHGVFKTTIHNLKVVGIDIEKNLIMIMGSIPGPINNLVVVKSTNRPLKNKKGIEIVGLNLKNESISAVQGNENG